MHAPQKRRQRAGGRSAFAVASEQWQRPARRLQSLRSRTRPLIKSKKADWRLVAAAQAMLFALTDARPLDWLMKSDPYDAHLSSSLLAT